MKSLAALRGVDQHIGAQGPETPVSVVIDDFDLIGITFRQI